MKNSLLLFTSKYPLGTGETFIEPELNELSKHYKEIYILPLVHGIVNKSRRLPKNAVVLDPIETGKIKLRDVRLGFIKILIKEFIYCKKPISFIRTLRSTFRTLIQSNKRAIDLENKYSDLLDRSDLYAFWMEDWTTTLGLLSQKNHLRQFICRVHGYDLYESRRSYGILPLRQFQLESVYRVVPVSEAGLKHLMEKHPHYKSKFQLGHLGTPDPETMSAISNESIYTIVSCSNVISIKRVLLLARLLKKTSLPLRWIHFGDGHEMSELYKIQNENENSLLEMILMGQKSTSQIAEFYSNKHIDLFIHLSETEGGVPLAIQEALSYGIPVLACNAGGVGEVVNNETGKIISIQFSEEEFYCELKLLLENFCRDLNKRTKAKKYWKDNFDIKVLTEKFTKLFPKKRTEE